MQPFESDIHNPLPEIPGNSRNSVLIYLRAKLKTLLYIKNKGLFFAAPNSMFPRFLIEEIMQFLPILASISTQGISATGIVSGIGVISIAAFGRLLSHACLIQAFLSFFIAGQMGESSFTAGVKHACVLLLITLVPPRPQKGAGLAQGGRGPFNKTRN
jgi:hypothetical protein